MERVNDGSNHSWYALLICSAVIRTVIRAVSRGCVDLRRRRPCWEERSNLVFKDLYLLMWCNVWFPPPLLPRERSPLLMLSSLTSLTTDNWGSHSVSNILRSKTRDLLSLPLLSLFWYMHCALWTDNTAPSLKGQNKTSLTLSCIRVRTRRLGW